MNGELPIDERTKEMLDRKFANRIEGETRRSAHLNDMRLQTGQMVNVCNVDGSIKSTAKVTR